MLSSQCLSTGSVPPRCHARHQQHLRSCFHQAPFRRLLHRRKTFQLRLQHQKPSCNASAGGGASSDEEYNSIYSILPGDSQSPLLYSALQTSDSETESPLSSLDATASADGAQMSDQEPGKKPPRVPHRWRVVFAIGVAFILCNMDKVNMSVAVLPMSKDLGWTGLERGLVNSAFFYGYAATQIPAGWVSTKIGGAKVLLAGVFLWSLGTLVAPPCAKLGILALCASRVLVGLGEGLAPSAATSVLAATIPERERARAVTVVFGSLDIGSAIGLTLCGPLITLAGWPSVFYLFAVLGLLWCGVWPLMKPEKADTALAVEEQPQHITAAAGQAAGAPRAVPWLKFMQSSAVWAVIVAHFCFNYGYYVLLAWLPSFFQLALGLDISNSSILTLIPYLAMIAATPFVGPVADGLVHRGWSLTNVRKLCQGIAFAGPLVCMAACALLLPAPGAVTPLATSLIVGVLSASFAMGSFARGGLYCVHQDINPRYAGALLGITNTAGALPGIVGVSLVGLVLDRTASWTYALFLPIGLCYLFGLIVFTALASSERQEFA
mmetsp:Transcript_20703/g.62399  ORF Transcript_20703/g.62399 Transcript_20703/m.62399 type:complete len:551 (+) Transcript_20703:239-1891(+)